MVECLTDPAGDLLWCDGKGVPWKEARDYVCHPLDEHEAYRR